MLFRTLFPACCFVLALPLVGCGAGPANGGGAPTTTSGILPGGPVNTGGAPDFNKTNRTNLPGGPINAGGGPTLPTTTSTTSAPPQPAPSTPEPEPTPDTQSDAGDVSL